MYSDLSGMLIYIHVYPPPPSLLFLFQKTIRLRSNNKLNIRDRPCLCVCTRSGLIGALSSWCTRASIKSSASVPVILVEFIDRFEHSESRLMISDIRSIILITMGKKSALWTLDRSIQYRGRMNFVNSRGSVRDFFYWFILFREMY